MPQSQRGRSSLILNNIESLFQDSEATVINRLDKISAIQSSHDKIMARILQDWFKERENTLQVNYLSGFHSATILAREWHNNNIEDSLLDQIRVKNIIIINTRRNCIVWCCAFSIDEVLVATGVDEAKLLKKIELNDDSHLHATASRSGLIYGEEKAKSNLKQLSENPNIEQVAVNKSISLLNSVEYAGDLLFFEVK